MTEENRVTSKTEHITVDGTPWLILLTILLVVGKVAGWWAGMSWMWVFSPLWLPFALVFCLMGFLAAAVLVAGIVILIKMLLER